jgi:hypothetical protein
MPSGSKSDAAKKKGQRTEMEEMEAEMIALRENKNLAGGMLLPWLHAVGMQVFSKSFYRELYWGIIIMFFLFGWWSSIMVSLVMGSIAFLASFKRRGRPDGIPLAPKGIDVLLGRPLQASKEVPGLHSNNNVTITTFRDTYVLAYRQSDVHFPSGATRLVVAHSKDLNDWSIEWTYANGCDLREMLLFEVKGKLMLYFFSLKPEHGQFKPIHVYYTVSGDGKLWAEPKEVCYSGEVPWEIKTYGTGDDAICYKSSYLGDHYGTKDIIVLFEQSRDGLKWEPVPPCSKESSSVYRGGVSEVSFEFTTAGDLVAIGRVEDGDSTGFGSQLFYAKKGALGSWTPLKVCVPWRFDSPRLASISQGEILLFARYAPLKFHLAPSWLEFHYQKVVNLVTCSLACKSAAVYRLAPYEEWGDNGENAVQLVRCFENSAGDTGFFSIVRELGSSTASSVSGWVVANYTSTTCHSHAPWIYGQMMPSHVFVFRCQALSIGEGKAS